jgi:hypothetical protein
MSDYLLKHYVWIGRKEVPVHYTYQLKKIRLVQLDGYETPSKYFNPEVIAMVETQCKNWEDWEKKEAAMDYFKQLREREEL